MDIIKHSQEPGLHQKLTAAIKTDGTFDLNLIDKMSINEDLRKYKNKNGTVNYLELFNIPVASRIAAMSQSSMRQTSQIISVALTLCFESMNLKRPMGYNQIVDLAEAIIDSSHENDKISLEDLMLFLQKLSRGEYGEMYESMDMPKFMSKFDEYRDDRWAVAVQIKNEKEDEHKNLGYMERTNQTNPIADSMANFAGRIGDLKDKLKEKDEQLKFLKGQ